MTTAEASIVIKGGKSLVKQRREADVLVVDGVWDDALQCSAESLIARLYGKTLAHEQCFKGGDKFKFCKFVPPSNPIQIAISDKAKEKHKKMFNALESAALDKKVTIVEPSQLGLVKQGKKETIFNLHLIKLREELTRTTTI